VKKPFNFDIQYWFDLGYKDGLGKKAAIFACSKGKTDFLGDDFPLTSELSKSEAGDAYLDGYQDATSGPIDGYANEYEENP
jgi:hypothetical protein